MPPRGLEDADGAEDVHVCIQRGTLDGDTDIRLRGKVEDDLRPDGVENLVGLADIGDVQPHGRTHVGG